MSLVGDEFTLAVTASVEEDRNMPKMKTNRSVYKKFRVSGNGKVKRGQANRSHNTAKRSQKRMRHLRGLLVLEPADAKRVVKLLPYMR